MPACHAQLADWLNVPIMDSHRLWKVVGVCGNERQVRQGFAAAGTPAYST